IIPGIFRPPPPRRLYSVASELFRDERLPAAVTFQTMYLGISPYDSPAVYGLLPFSELGVGIWFPEGGLYALPRALERLARAAGGARADRAPGEAETLRG